MFRVSEQQASDLLRRCKAIREAADPVVYSQIEALVQQAVKSGQLTDAEVNRLYDLLNQAMAMDNNNHKADGDADWEEEEKPAVAIKDARGEGDERRDRRNHILLCSSANLRTVEAMRRRIKSITSPGKREARTNEIRR